MTPSRTSILVAAARALAAHDPDPAIRNPDWLAERFVGPAERALIAPHPIVDALEQPYSEALQDQEVVGICRLLLARTRFIDEKLIQSLARGTRQLVLLGAGFDSRAYRFREQLAGAKVFEIDAPATQEYKRRRVCEVLGDPPPNVTYAPIDFHHDPLAEVLHRAGCDPAAPSFFTWEGVSMYVEEPSILETLGAIGHSCAPGSTLLMDFVSRESLALLATAAKTPASQLKFAAAWGEPWVFGIPAGKESEFFAQTGFDVVETLRLTGDEAAARYLTRRDGTLFGDLRNGWATQGARAGYSIAELRLQSGLEPRQ